MMMKINMKKILLLLCCLSCYFIMAQQTVIKYNYLTIQNRDTDEIISSGYVNTILKWEENSDDYTIIKTGDSNYLLLHDKKYITTTTVEKTGITFNIFKFKDNKGEDISIALANDYSTLMMFIGNSSAIYANR